MCAADSRFAFSTAVGMVDGVHGGASDRGSEAHMSLSAGFTDIDILMLYIADFTDGGPALQSESFLISPEGNLTVA